MLDVEEINPEKGKLRSLLAMHREVTVNLVSKDTEVGSGRQEADRRHKEGTCGCSERGREVTRCGGGCRG